MPSFLNKDGSAKQKFLNNRKLNLNQIKNHKIKFLKF